MRKLLISILIILLLLITVYSVTKGLSIGNIKILGFNNIKSESEKLDSEIAEITKLKEQTYKKTISDIESNARLLLQEKEKYATLVNASTDSEIEKATHGQNYEQDFLWAKIGNHATAQGVKLKFDIAEGTLNKNNFDLNFTVTGTYTNITEFIMALENDNLLGFKIENFKLYPQGAASSTSTNKNTTNTTTTKTTSTGSSGMLQATFNVLDIGINIDKTLLTNNLEEETTETSDANTNKNTTNKNTTTTNKNTSKVSGPTTEGVVEE